MTVPMNQHAVDVAGMEARMDEIRLKEILGGPLTDQELMCLQIEQNGFGCGTCSRPTDLVDRHSQSSLPLEA
jgi:hypothetical protein